MAPKSRVAGWYWITSAILTPFVLIATLFWAYYAQQVQNYRAEGRRLVSQLEQDHEAFEPLLNHMKEVSEATGWKMTDPIAPDRLAALNTPRPSVFEGEERNLPAEKRSPLLNAYLDAEGRFYGATADDAGYVEEYLAAREWLAEFEKKLQGYIYLKGYQYYTVKTIDVGGESIAIAGGDLSRQIRAGDDQIPVPPDDVIERARGDWTSKKAPFDKVMQEPTKITLELVFRKQVQLIRDLVSANLHQYNLLYSDVSGEVDIYEVDENGKIKRDKDGKPNKIGSAWVGFEGEKRGLDKTIADLGGLSRRVGERKDESVAKLDGAREGAETVAEDTEARDSRLQTMYVSTEARIDELKIEFEGAKLAHEGDAQKFDDLVRNLPRLKVPQKLEKSDPDGEVSYSDYARGVTHIDLGYSDGVKQGQRFEVWRLHGYEKDEFVGVVEIVRMLSAHYSLCTVLTLTNADDPVRKGDKIVSQLWQDGEFLTVALHGDYEPPNEAYSKARLTELLKLAGVTVVEKVQPGTDMVILGSNLLGDEWYRRARNDLRFETLKEDDVRLYVDPR
jgi:hypothetical protein